MFEWTRDAAHVSGRDRKITWTCNNMFITTTHKGRLEGRVVSWEEGSSCGEKTRAWVRHQPSHPFNQPLAPAAQIQPLPGSVATQL